MSQNVLREIVVNVSQEAAFKVFTEETTAWWPKEHHIGTSPAVRQVIEPSAGGSWFTINEDGSQCRIGKVLAWDPPKRLSLAWQITGDWQYDPTFETIVDVNFEALAADQTRVSLEHKNLSRYGTHENAVRASFESEGGWTKTLKSFAHWTASSRSRAA